MSKFQIGDKIRDKYHPSKTATVMSLENVPEQYYGVRYDDEESEFWLEALRYRAAEEMTLIDSVVPAEPEPYEEWFKS